MHQNSNQILIDMKNIYQFRDDIELMADNGYIYQENIDSIP